MAPPGMPPPGVSKGLHNFDVWLFVLCCGNWNSAHGKKVLLLCYNEQKELDSFVLNFRKSSRLSARTAWSGAAFHLGDIVHVLVKCKL